MVLQMKMNAAVYTVQQRNGCLHEVSAHNTPFVMSKDDHAQERSSNIHKAPVCLLSEGRATAYHVVK